MVTAPRILTEAEFLALPDDERFERELIRGELKERPMTTRGYPHSLVITRLCQLLGNWIDTQPEPRGHLIGGEARVRLQAEPPTFVGVDIAYIAPGALPQNPSKARYADGPPALVVEILSPSDQDGSTTGNRGHAVASWSRLGSRARRLEGTQGGIGTGRLSHSRIVQR